MKRASRPGRQGRSGGGFSLLRSAVLTLLLLTSLLIGCSESGQDTGWNTGKGAGIRQTRQETGKQKTEGHGTQARVSESWTGDDKEGVARYLETYEKLPSNYMTKKEARKLGWEGGALHLLVPDKCIGGDSFGNYEGLLPDDKDYRECDIDTLNARGRGAKRLIYSAEGGDLDIWYTGDHYESFDLIYGDGE